MMFVVDTAGTADVRSLVASGLLDDITPNPSLVAKTGKKFLDILAENRAVVPGPVSAEVAAIDYAGMLDEARVPRQVADHVTIKVPLTADGLRACRYLTDDGAMVNLTHCFAAAQAIFAAMAGATFFSPFVGRMDDIGEHGMGLTADMMRIFGSYPIVKTELLVASVRSPNHPVGEKGEVAFPADWAQSRSAYRLTRCQ